MQAKFTTERVDSMVMECLQDQLASTGDPYNDDPIIEDQMEYLSEYLLTKAQKYIETERFHSAFELVWACIWHLEYGAGQVYPRKCSDKTYQQSWTSEAEDLLVAAASGMRSAWTPARWGRLLQHLCPVCHRRCFVIIVTQLYILYKFQQSWLVDRKQTDSRQQDV